MFLARRALLTLLATILVLVAAPALAAAQEPTSGVSDAPAIVTGGDPTATTSDADLAALEADDEAELPACDDAAGCVSTCDAACMAAPDDDDAADAPADDAADAPAPAAPAAASAPVARTFAAGTFRARSAGRLQVAVTTAGGVRVATLKRSVGTRGRVLLTTTLTPAGRKLLAATPGAVTLTVATAFRAKGATARTTRSLAVASGAAALAA